jgi:hypothetical protein
MDRTAVRDISFDEDITSVKKIMNITQIAVNNDLKM